MKRARDEAEDVKPANGSGAPPSNAVAAARSEQDEVNLASAVAAALGLPLESAAVAAALDAADALRAFRDEFAIPTVASLAAESTARDTAPAAVADAPSPPSVYLCGNSLGLQPRRA